MFFPNANPHGFYELYKAREQSYIEEAERARLLREAGVDQRSLLECIACKSLYGLGAVLVKFGNRLQKFDMPRTAHTLTSSSSGI